ncbi:TetR-like C-terminal domain-containing protein [Streptomyces sp. NPDC059009]|uniref:TetR-like C-terminal domain-containing protein n=1 Tax=Streptomyces sp. NPDC059009 TaxID=3346694 RepID=UPI0036C79EE4
MTERPEQEPGRPGQRQERPEQPGEPGRPPHGAARPGGRTARTRAAVLAAALAELDEGGFGALTFDRLAARSGVHVSTLRRRWRTVEMVTVDLLLQYASGTIPTPDTGSLRGDLCQLARNIADFHAVPRNRSLIEGIVVAAAQDPGAAEVVRSLFVARIKQVSAIVVRAVERGEVPADTDPDEVIEAMGAPFYYRILILRGPIDDRLVRLSAEAAYRAAVAGVFGAGE